MFSKMISILFFRIKNTIDVEFKNYKYNFKLGKTEKHSLGNSYYFDNNKVRFQLNFSKINQKIDLVFSAYFNNKLLYRKLYTSINHWTINFEEIILESITECYEILKLDEKLIDLITSTIEYTATGCKYLDGYNKIKVIKDNEDQKKLFLVITKLNNDEVIVELLYLFGKLWSKNVYRNHPEKLTFQRLILFIKLNCEKSDYPLQGYFYLNTYSPSTNSNHEKISVLNIFEDNYSSESIYKFYLVPEKDEQSLFIFKNNEEIFNYKNRIKTNSDTNNFQSFTNEILHFLKHNMPDYEYIKQLEFEIPLTDEQVEYIDLMNY